MNRFQKWKLRMQEGRKEGRKEEERNKVTGHLRQLLAAPPLTSNNGYDKTTNNTQPKLPSNGGVLARDARDIAKYMFCSSRGLLNVRWRY